MNRNTHDNAPAPEGRVYAAHIGTYLDPNSRASSDGSDGSDGIDGSKAGVLQTVRNWFERYICVSDDVDLDVLTLWVAHTWVVFETYTTPRLILDSTMPGSGKTTVLDHFSRLAHQPIQMASISSPALLARMLKDGPRTILVDEVDRTLDPKNPGTGELLAILNSGYRRGGTRPVLVPVKGGDWEANEMPTFGPVVMAGNAPALPDDTRSRSIRVLLMPDMYGIAEDSDWELIEPDAHDLRDALSNAMDNLRDAVRAATPEMPAGCVGRMKEKWRPLARVAEAVGGRWPEVVTELIERDIAEMDADRREGLVRIPPAVKLLHDLFSVWDETEPFVGTADLINRLVSNNPDMWGDGSQFGKRLTPQRFGRMLAQSAKAHSVKNSQDVRGWQRIDLETVWRRIGVAPAFEPSKPSEPSEPSELAGDEVPW